MEGQGDLFDLEISTYKPSDHIETGQHVKQILRPLAVEVQSPIRQIAHQGRSTGLPAYHASAIYELAGAVHNTPSVLNELLSHKQENRSQPRISLMDDVHAFREWIKRQQ